LARNIRKDVLEALEVGKDEQERTALEEKKMQCGGRVILWKWLWNIQQQHSSASNVLEATQPK
jgi:uncharacterized protein YeaC (DUF1315 family)